LLNTDFANKNLEIQADMYYNKKVNMFIIGIVKHLFTNSINLFGIIAMLNN